MAMAAGASLSGNQLMIVREKINTGKIERDEGEICNDDQLSGIERRLPVIARADALADHGDDCEAHAHARYDNDIEYTPDNRVCGDGGGAEPGDERLHQQLAEVEQAVFKTVWHADAENAAHNPPVKANRKQMTQIDDVIAVSYQDEH